MAKGSNSKNPKENFNRKDNIKYALGAKSAHKDLFVGKNTSPKNDKGPEKPNNGSGPNKPKPSKGGPTGSGPNGPRPSSGGAAKTPPKSDPRYDKKPSRPLSSEPPKVPYKKAGVKRGRLSTR